MNSAQFNPRLESVRGLAALMVAASHSLVVYPAGAVIKPLVWIFNGDAAVTMFFVLSGLVLGMGLQRAGRGSGREFLAYGARRVFRIYPVFLLTTLAIVAFVSIAYSVAGPQFWFNHVLYRPTMLNSAPLPLPGELKVNLLLLGSSLNLVTWTLGVELFCSLLLPVAHYARMRMPPSGAWLLLSLSGFLVFLGQWFLLLGWRDLEGAYRWDYLAFFYLFYLGYLLPLLGPKLFAADRITPRGARVVFAVAATAFLGANRCGDTYRFVAGVSAWMMLAVLMYNPGLREFRVLDWPLVRFYGRISYSFYLLHDLVLISLARISAHFVFDDRAPAFPIIVNAALFVSAVMVATALAALMHRFIELPCIALGKRVAQKICELPLISVAAPVAVTR